MLQLLTNKTTANIKNNSRKSPRESPREEKAYPGAIGYCLLTDAGETAIGAKVAVTSGFEGLLFEKNAALLFACDAFFGNDAYLPLPMLTAYFFDT